MDKFPKKVFMISKLLLITLFALPLSAQLFSNRNWNTVGKGLNADKPATCTSQRDVYICSDCNGGTGAVLYCDITGAVPNSWASIGTGGGAGSVDGPHLCPTAGTSTAYTCTVSGIVSYTNGVAIWLRPHTTSGVNPTVNISSLGAIPLVTKSGNVTTNYLTANKIYLFVYNGGSFEHIALDPLQGAGGGIVVNADGTIDTSNYVCLRTNSCTVSGYRDQSGGSWTPPESTIANLPSAASNTRKVYKVTDATSLTTCSAGGGSTQTWCVSNGSSWVTMAGTGSGDVNPVTILDYVVYGTEVVGDGSNHKTYYTYTIPGNTLTTNDSIKGSCVFWRSGYANNPVLRWKLGDGGGPKTTFTVEGAILELYFEYKVVNATTLSGYIWGNRGTSFIVNNADSGVFDNITTFDAANNFTVEVISVATIPGVDVNFRPAYCKIERIRPSDI